MASLLAQKAFSQLKKVFSRYGTIDDGVWQEIIALSSLVHYKRDQEILHPGAHAQKIHFIVSGCVRTFYLDEEGNSYNKNLFFENSLPAAIVSLLTESYSDLGLQALEDTTIIEFNFKSFRSLAEQQPALKDIYIAYLEQNWIIEKEQREISIVMENATERYLKLIELHPNIEGRIAQHHIASHLGITPTQLSRIKKSLK